NEQGVVGRLALDHAAHVSAPALIVAAVADDAQIVRAAQHLRKLNQLAAIPFLAAGGFGLGLLLRLSARLLRRRRPGGSGDQRGAVFPGLGRMRSGCRSAARLTTIQAAHSLPARRPHSATACSPHIRSAYRTWPCPWTHRWFQAAQADWREPASNRHPHLFQK